MQYFYTTLVEIITLVLTLFVGVTAFYFLIRKWQKTTILKAFKAIALYELASFLLCLIFSSLLFKVSNDAVFRILEVLLFSVVLFFVFYFIMKKMLLMDWKKSLTVFLLVVMILFPCLNFLRVRLGQQIVNSNLAIFVKENLELKKEIEDCMQNSFFCFSSGLPEPLSFKILGKIELGLFSWPSAFIGEII